ncbi:MAG: ATP-dependent DNA helicase RecG [Patescibacteria group bacterium]
MEINLNTEIKYLKGVGPKVAPKLNKLGIYTAQDLIYHYPRRYKDYTQVTKISNLTNNLELKTNNFTIRARVVGIANKRTRRRGFTVTEAVVEDNSGSLKVVWFNQPYLAKMLKAGSEVILNGKVSYDSFSHSLVMESPNRANRPKIVPVYPETAGVSSYFIARLISNINPPAGGQISKLEEYLPQPILDKYDLLGIRSALKNIHEPEDSQALSKARRRIAFDELFLIAIRSQLIKEEIATESAPKIETADPELKKFADALPFELTTDQKKAVWQIAKDLALKKPMNRLLNGDVGSGKTAVAAFAAYIAAKAGFRTALMAPTEILAKQHFETLNKLLEKSDVSVGLLTSSTRKANVAGELERQVIVGTHSLVQGKVEIKNLGLVIVDEQHRFGVNQRAELTKSREGLRPHFLSMTATPIPRSLHLALFGDLDLSIIKSMPKGRKPIKTRFVEETNRLKAYDFIRRQIQSGRQAFVICPLIEESEAQTRETLFDEDRKSVMAEYNRLSKQIFPDLKIGMLHGRMPASPRRGRRGLAKGGKSKDEIMAEFKACKLDILVSTSVVEVGVDIPNATIMMIEDAERFGLAQLHQFRGRVGRGEHQSFCFVFSSTQNPRAIERLKSFENILDGFKLAEQDLKNRGAGDMFGTIQSGYNELRMASYSDIELIDEAAEGAKIVTNNIEKYPAVMEKIDEFLTHKHLE